MTGTFLVDESDDGIGKCNTGIVKTVDCTFGLVMNVQSSQLISFPRHCNGDSNLVFLS